MAGRRRNFCARKLPVVKKRFAKRRRLDKKARALKLSAHFMSDPRYDKLAKLLVEYSCALKKGESIFIDVSDIPDRMTIALIRAVRKVGGIPLAETRQSRVMRELVKGTGDAHAKLTRDVELYRMKKVQAYIAIRGAENTSELSDVPPKVMQGYSKILRPMQNYRVNKTRWVVLRWPHPPMAQQAGMSSQAFEKFYFDVCTMDYARMSKAMQPLAGRMVEADRVRITGPGTELSFSIKGIDAVPCDGRRNIPDGEVFTAPVRDSVNGTLQYNARTICHGVIHDDVRFEFKDGRIVDATSSRTKALNEALDADEGARYIGEFAIGFNPYITEPMLDILFDEKIAGSFHFTPGQAYEEADNGNRSSVHWDVVCLQDAARGGGEIWFDGQLVRKDGLFVTDDLQALNPKNLM